MLVPVLRGVNLEVTPGEWVANLGPSGSGKLTLLNLLVRLDRPNRGTYELEGEAASGSLPPGDVTGTIQKLGGFRALLGPGGTGSGGIDTGGRGGFAGVAGAATVNGNVITITTTAGTVKVNVTWSATFAKTVTAAESDVTPGERATVRQGFSTPNSGGPVNAAAVIQPAVGVDHERERDLAVPATRPEPRRSFDRVRPLGRRAAGRAPTTLRGTVL